MLLYHGSKVEAPYPDISYCNTHNDFGRSFYLTDDYDTRLRLLREFIRICVENMEQTYRISNGNHIVYTNCCGVE